VDQQGGGDGPDSHNPPLHAGEREPVARLSAARIPSSGSTKLDAVLPELLRGNVHQTRPPRGPSDRLDCDPKFAQSPDDKSLFSYQIDFPPAEEFDVDLEWLHGQDVDLDNTIVYEAVVFVGLIEVEVYFPGGEMTILFTELGSPGFQDQPVRSSGSLHQRCGNLIMPGAGYILTMQRR
jgi:hypothetical protein